MPKAPAESPQAKLKRECESELATKKAAFETLSKAGKHWEAALALRNCAEALSDGQLMKLVADAEIKSHIADLSDPKKSSGEKAIALDRLLTDYPAVGAKYAAKGKQQVAAAEEREKTAERKARRSRGVRVGMTEEEVLDSSWGRPEQVNRTITTFGTREQWVYGGRNYLYFENGKLTAIQN